MKSKELTLEKTIGRLEEIVRELEQGSAPLEQALALYEEGVVLFKHATAILDRAQEKIKVLSQDTGGKFKLEDEEEA